MEEKIDQSSNTTTCYYCNICSTKPDQLSHHKAHLKTQKHIFQKTSFKQCIEKSYQWAHLSREKCIQMFQNEIGLNWSKENKDAFLKWRFETQLCLEKLYPNVIYPQGDTNCLSDNKWYENVENIEKTVIDFIEVNESVKTFVEQKIFNKIVNKNKLIEESFTIFDAVNNSREYDIALWLFKRYHNTYSCKSFLGKGVWIDKTDSTINSDIVYSSIITIITTQIKNEFIEKYEEYKDIYIEGADVICLGEDGKEINLKKLCQKFENLINLLSKDKFIKTIMKEAKELFYDN
jgi:hypothetical protein